MIMLNIVQSAFHLNYVEFIPQRLYKKKILSKLYVTHALPLRRILFICHLGPFRKVMTSGFYDRAQQINVA